MATTERAVLAGGCFWGMQDLIRKLPGVIKTRVGYTGGDVPNATYRNHGAHAEGIEIIFDPEKISYRRILEYFFQIHDPTTRNRQGNDVGSSYVERKTYSGWRSWGNAREFYRRVKAPVTLIYGDGDWSRTPERERTATNLRNVQVITLEETGHFSSLEKPREVADLIRKASQ